MGIKNEKCGIFFWVLIKLLYLQPRKGKWFGTLAQSVEQQTENLCVPGSIPGGTTKNKACSLENKLFCFNAKQNKRHSFKID